MPGLYLTRAQYFGSLEDYDRALAVGEKAVKLAPNEGEAWLLRAAARQSLHQFDGAEQDLVEAQKHGAEIESAEGMRASILQARGKLDEALALRKRAMEKHATLDSLALYGLVLGEMGRVAEAEQQLTEAQYLYRSVAPIPVAWLYFQFGLLEERNGRPQSARELYQAAIERLPQYAPAIGHLAGLSEKEAAVKLLQPLVERSDDPEYWGQLAALTGDQALEARARKRYDALVAKHPEAFADHAARFWLSREPKRALALAQRNAKLRPTREAWLLVAEAAHAAGQGKLACESTQKVLAMPFQTEAIKLKAATFCTAK